MDQGPVVGQAEVVLRTKITRKKIEGLSPEGERIEVCDTEVSGLRLIVYPSGERSFFVRYRVAGGRQRRFKLARYGQITIEQARALAREKLAEVARGEDPARERREARQGATVAETCKRFIEECVATRKPLTVEQYAHVVDKYVLPALGAEKIADIAPADVSRLIRSVGKDKPVMANRARAVLHRLFNLAERWGMRPQNSNPAHGIERYREKKRHRDLSEIELARLAQALTEAEKAGEDPNALAAIRLLLFTGCRRGEVLGLRWSEVGTERGLLRLGDSKTGEKSVHLNCAALEVIESRRDAGDTFVFAMKRDVGETHLSEDRLRKAWEKIRKAAGLGAREDGTPAFRLHDLRHSFASYGAGAGLSLHTIGSLLGHRTPTTTQRYADLADSPARRAAELVGEQIRQATKRGQREMKRQEKRGQQ